MLREIKERKQKEEKLFKKLSKRLGEVEKTQQDIEELIEEYNKLEEKNEIVKKRLQEVEKGLEGHDISRIFFVVIMIAIVIAAIYVHNTDYDRLQEQIHALQRENQALQETVDAISVNVGAKNGLNATEVFVDTVLPMKEREMYDKNGNTFYYDPDCKYAITNPIFCDWDSLRGEDSKGNKLTIYRLTNGDFAYIPSNFNVDIVNLN